MIDTTIQEGKRKKQKRVRKEVIGRDVDEEDKEGDLPYQGGSAAADGDRGVEEGDEPPDAGSADGDPGVEEGEEPPDAGAAAADGDPGVEEGDEPPDAGLDGDRGVEEMRGQGAGRGEKSEAEGGKTEGGKKRRKKEKKDKKPGNNREAGNLGE